MTNEYIERAKHRVELMRKGQYNKHAFDPPSDPSTIRLVWDQEAGRLVREDTTPANLNAGKPSR